MKINLKTETVTVNKPVKVQQATGVTLDLTLEEALVIVEIMGHITGSPQQSIRGTADRLYYGIKDALPSELRSFISLSGGLTSGTIKGENGSLNTIRNGIATAQLSSLES